ncbi:TPA: hypothetical protein SMO80_001875 [Proteus mirabilis]|nr:hypothetical protein [Proteus mirabilis]
MIYGITRGLFFVADHVCRYSRSWEWLMWLVEEARTLRNVEADLKLAERYAGEQNRPHSISLMKCTLYDAGFAYGRLLLWRADGLMRPWPACLLRRLPDIGQLIDAVIWQKGCEAGLDETVSEWMAMEMVDEYLVGIELSD